MEHPVKHTIDAAAIATTVGSLVNILPALAAGFSILWSVLRLIEMFTGKTINELIRKKQ